MQDGKYAYLGPIPFSTLTALSYFLLKAMEPDILMHLILLPEKLFKISRHEVILRGYGADLPME